MKPFYKLFENSASVLSVAFLLTLSILQGCSHIPDNTAMEKSYAVVNHDDTALDKMIETQRKDHPDKSGAILLANGLDAFVARASLAIAAQKSLDIQYYLYHDDTIGGLLTHQILQAADRGVRVRLLLDDFDLAGKDKNLLILASHPNIYIRVFNPFNRKTSRAGQLATRLGDVTRRMHNKLFIADNSMVILGGRNIGDEYFDIDPNRAFSDLDVLLAGKVVSQASESFDLYWNSEVVYPVSLLAKHEFDESDLDQGREALFSLSKAQETSDYAKALRHSDFAQKIQDNALVFTWLDATIYYDHPIKVRRARDEREYHLIKSLEPYFQGLSNNLLIITPYFVPGEQGTEFLTALANKGIQVNIITNSLASNDVSAVHSGYARYRKQLLRAGISLYEIKPKINVDTGKAEKNKSTFGSSKTSLHAKSFVLDKTHIFIGSLNLDPRSAYENTEVGTMLHSPYIAKQMADTLMDNVHRFAFKVSLKDDKLHWVEVTDNDTIGHTVDPYTNWWQRLSVKLLQFLPIESQL